MQLFKHPSFTTTNQFESASGVYCVLARIRQSATCRPTADLGATLRLWNILATDTSSHLSISTHASVHRALAKHQKAVCNSSQHRNEIGRIFVCNKNSSPKCLTQISCTSPKYIASIDVFSQYFDLLVRTGSSYRHYVK